MQDIQDRLEKLATSSSTTEKHLSKVQGGYQMRNKTLRQKLVDAHEALEKSRIDLDTKRVVSAGEEAAIGSRLEKLREEVAAVSKRERWAQELYRERKEELDSLS
jgi:pre-mRNA-splicing factor CDC5/CEF1